jgi:hypothetical protein
MTALRPEIAEAAAWLQAAIDGTPYGEVCLTFRLHEGREALQERTQTARIKPTTGNTGGHYERSR